MNHRQKKIRPLLKRFAALLLSFSIALPGEALPVFAEPSASPVPLPIPAAFGRIEEFHEGHSGRTVIYIQDAHTSLDAQRNIAALIGHLVENHGVRKVFEEGYEGEVPSDRYFGALTPELRETVAYSLMDELRLGGAEYAHINRKRDFKLIGADSIKLLLENINWYRESAGIRAEVEKDLSQFENEFKKLADLSFGKELKEWLKLRGRLDAGTLDLASYLARCAALLPNGEGMSRGSAPREGLGAYPNLELLLAARDASEDPVLSEKIKTLETKTLFREIEAFENALAQRFLSREEDLKLFGYLKLTRLLKRLAAVEVTSSEYEAVKEGLRTVSSQQLSAFITRRTGKSLVTSKRWEANIRRAVRFYELALERERAVEARLLQHFKEKGTAVLVFGGFHKSGIRDLLRANGFSYYVVTPEIAEISETHEARYRELMSAGISGIPELPLVKEAARYIPVFVEGEYLGRREAIENMILEESLRAAEVSRSELRSYAETESYAAVLERLNPDRELPKDRKTTSLFTAPFRWPDLYRRLFAVKEEFSGRKIRVALLGPGHTAGQSYQTVETLAVLNGLDAEMTVIEADSEVVRRVRSTSGYMLEYDPDFRTGDLFHPMIEALAPALGIEEALTLKRPDANLKKYSVAWENITISAAAFQGWFEQLDYGEEELDLLIATYSLWHALNLMPKEERFDLVVRVLKALRADGRARAFLDIYLLKLLYGDDSEEAPFAEELVQYRGDFESALAAAGLNAEVRIENEILEVRRLPEKRSELRAAGPEEPPEKLPIGEALRRKNIRIEDFENLVFPFVGYADTQPVRYARHSFVGHLAENFSGLKNIYLIDFGYTPEESAQIKTKLQKELALVLPERQAPEVHVLTQDFYTLAKSGSFTALERGKTVFIDKYPGDHAGFVRKSLRYLEQALNLGGLIVSIEPPGQPLPFDRANRLGVSLPGYEAFLNIQVWIGTQFEKGRLEAAFQTTQAEGLRDALEKEIAGKTLEEIYAWLITRMTHGREMEGKIYDRMGVPPEIRDWLLTNRHSGFSMKREGGGFEKISAAFDSEDLEIAFEGSGTNIQINLRDKPNRGSSRSELRVEEMARPAGIILDADELARLNEEEAAGYVDELLILVQKHKAFDLYIEESDAAAFQNSRFEKFRKLRSEHPERVHLLKYGRARLNKKQILIHASFFAAGTSEAETRDEINRLKETYRIRGEIFPLEYSRPGSLSAFLSLAETLSAAALIHALGEAYAVKGPDGRWRIMNSFADELWNRLRNDYAVQWSA